jgi:hypothetical protein
MLAWQVHLDFSDGIHRAGVNQDKQCRNICMGREKIVSVNTIAPSKGLTFKADGYLLKGETRMSVPEEGFLS